MWGSEGSQQSWTDLEIAHPSSEQDVSDMSVDFCFSVSAHGHANSFTSLDRTSFLFYLLIRRSIVAPEEGLYEKQGDNRFSVAVLQR